MKKVIKSIFVFICIFLIISLVFGFLFKFKNFDFVEWFNNLNKVENTEKEENKENDVTENISILSTKIQIYGNSVQDGTPTSTTPIAISSVGDLVTDASSENYGKYAVNIKSQNADKTVSSTKTIYLDEPLRGVGDYTDYVDVESGKIIRKVGVKTFNGTENWGYRSQEPDFILTNAFTDANSIKLVRDSFLCNYFTINTYSGVVVDKTFQIWSNGTTLGVMNFDYTDITSFKSWLAGLSSSGNPLTFNYVLATAIETSLTESQIQTLKSLPTYEGGTWIKNDNTTQGVITIDCAVIDNEYRLDFLWKSDNEIIFPYFLGKTEE